MAFPKAQKVTAEQTGRVGQINDIIDDLEDLEERKLEGDEDTVVKFKGLNIDDRVKINHDDNHRIRLYDSNGNERLTIRDTSIRFQDSSESLDALIDVSGGDLRITANNNIQVYGGINDEFIYGLDSSGITRVQGDFRPGYSASNPNLGNNNEGTRHRWGRLYARYSTDISSSIKTKEKLEDCSYGIEDIKKLKAVRYEQKDDTEVQRKKTKKKRKHLGFVAEDIAKVLPEVAGEKGESYRPTDMIPVLVNGIKQLSNRVEELETRLSKLEKSNDRK